jgi:hypothetical protein
MQQLDLGSTAAQCDWFFCACCASLFVAAWPTAMQAVSRSFAKTSADDVDAEAAEPAPPPTLPPPPLNGPKCAAAAFSSTSATSLLASSTSAASSSNTSSAAPANGTSTHSQFSALGTSRCAYRPPILASMAMPVSSPLLPLLLIQIYFGPCPHAASASRIFLVVCQPKVFPSPSFRPLSTRRFHQSPSCRDYCFE